MAEYVRKVVAAGKKPYLLINIPHKSAQAKGVTVETHLVWIETVDGWFVRKLDLGGSGNGKKKRGT
jgi:hypothetical protein